MFILDDLAKIKKIDKEKMREKLIEAPIYHQKAIQEAEKIKLPDNYSEITQIIACGMGGSAIGADLASDFSKIPFFVNRDYGLPDFTGENSLIVLISYSGNTEEVLSCIEEARKKQSKIFIITSGGILLKKAQSLKLPFYQIAPSLPPRAALSYLFVPIVKILSKLGVLKEGIELESSVASLNKFNKEISLEIIQKNNPAKLLASEIYSHLPVVIASQKFEGVARRWKTQFNENAKNFSFFDVLPELKHNTIEGLNFPVYGKNNLYFLLLQSDFDEIPVKKSFEALREFLTKEKIKTHLISVPTLDILSQKMALIYLGDWTSFYLAILNRANPSTTKNIQWIKERLGNS